MKRSFIDQTTSGVEIKIPNKKIKITDSQVVFKQENKHSIFPENTMDFYKNLQIQRQYDKNVLQLQMKNIFDLMELGLPNSVPFKQKINKNNQIKEKNNEEVKSDKNSLTPVIEIEDDS